MGRARAFSGKVLMLRQEHRFPNHIQGEQKMKVPYDAVLPEVNVLGSTMVYREAGNPDGPVALFLHGNPTSSYIWRNIIPLLAPVAHCIAPDLIVFFQMIRPHLEYRFVPYMTHLCCLL